MNKKQIINIIGLCILLGTYFTFCYTFLSAYFNGYTVLLDINHYGEAKLELWLIVISGMVFVLLFVHNVMKSDFLKEV